MRPQLQLIDVSGVATFRPFATFLLRQTHFFKAEVPEELLYVSRLRFKFHSTADAAHPQTRLGSQAGSSRHPMRPQRPTAGSLTQPAHAPRHAARGTWGCTPPAAASTPACSPPALLQNLNNTSCTHTHSTCSVVATLYYGFVCAAPGASSAFCPVLHCTAPLYVGNAHTHTHTHT